MLGTGRRRVGVGPFALLLLVPLLAGGVGGAPLTGDVAASEALIYLATASAGTEFVPGIYADVGGPCPSCRPARWAEDPDHPLHDPKRVVASPDGRALAVLQDNGVSIRALNGTVLAAVGGIGLARTVRWAPDGSFLVTAAGFHGLRKITPDGAVEFPSFGDFLDAWVLPNGTVVGVREEGGSYLFPGNHLLHEAPIPGDLVAPGGEAFLGVDPERGVYEERIAERRLRLVPGTVGHTPLAWDGTWMLTRYAGETGEPRWNVVRTSDGMPLVAGGLAGTPRSWSFRPAGGACAVMVDHGDGTSRLEVRTFAEDWAGFQVAYAAVPFADLTWARVEAALRVWGGGQPPPRPPASADAGRFAFLVHGAPSRAVASVRPDGSDLRMAWEVPAGEPASPDILGPGTAPGWIAFRLGSDVWEVHWTGGEPRHLVPYAAEGLAIAPDGRHLAVEVDDNFYGLILLRRNASGWGEVLRIPSAQRPVFPADGLLSYERGGMRIVQDLPSGQAFPVGPPNRATHLLPDRAAFLYSEGSGIYRASYGHEPGVGRREHLLSEAYPLAARGGYTVAVNQGAAGHGEGIVRAPDGTVRAIADLDYLVAAAFAADGSGFAALEIVSGDPLGVFHRIRFHPLSGGPPLLWPHANAHPFFPFPTAAPAPGAAGPDPEALALIGDTALPTYAIGEGTSGFVSGKVLYKSRFGKGSYIVVRDGAGAPVPVQRLGEAVLWDTSESPNGYYTVESTDESGGVLETASYLVQNPRSTGARIGAAAAAGLAITLSTSWMAGLAAAAKESAIEAAESKLASGAARGAIGFAGKGVMVTGVGLVGAGTLLGVAGAYEQSVGAFFDAARFAALLPYVGGALTLLFLAEMAMDRFYARHLGHEAEFRFWVPGALSLAASTLLFANPFGMPGHVSGVEGADREVGGRRGLANFLVLFALLLPFVAIARWRFEVYEVGVTAAMMLAVNIALPLGDLPGKHVWRWNKPAWALLAAGSLVLFSVSLLALATPLVFLAVGLAGAAGMVVLFAIRLPGAAR